MQINAIINYLLKKTSLHKSRLYKRQVFTSLDYLLYSETSEPEYMQINASINYF